MQGEKEESVKEQCISIKSAFCTFLDILGFSNLAINTTFEDRNILIDKIQTIHRLSDKLATEQLDIEHLKLLNRHIIALSDSVSVVTDITNAFKVMGNIEDMILSELWDIAFIQWNCVHQGIFLRGGISYGWVHYDDDNDIMISDALSRAHRIESKDVKYPIIGIDDEIISTIENAALNNPQYSEPQIGKHTDKIVINDKTIHYIDYLRICIDTTGTWASAEDHKEYLGEKDLEKRGRIMSRSFERSIVSYIKRHRDSIVNQLKLKHKPEVIVKYEWLREYHNSVLRSYEGRFSQSCYIS